MTFAFKWLKGKSYFDTNRRNKKNIKKTARNEKFKSKCQHMHR